MQLSKVNKTFVFGLSLYVYCEKKIYLWNVSGRHVSAISMITKCFKNM